MPFSDQMTGNNGFLYIFSAFFLFFFGKVTGSRSQAMVKKNKEAWGG